MWRLVCARVYVMAPDRSKATQSKWFCVSGRTLCFGVNALPFSSTGVFGTAARSTLIHQSPTRRTGAKNLEEIVRVIR